MQLFVGTSGYSYKEWKGTFYPQKLPAAQMLNFYGQHFSTVEINNTFYQMPRENVLESWAEQVPENFRFVLKVRQVITHIKRLKDVERETEYFLSAASVLGERLGPLLFQLPPNFKKDLPRLDAYLGFLHNRVPVAFEFRHESWFDQEVFDCLRAHSCGLCIADVEDLPHTELVSTAGWGYVRLRREAYTDEDLKAWLDRIRREKWAEAYIFFKHEDSGTGPKYAAKFLELAG